MVPPDSRRESTDPEAPAAARTVLLTGGIRGLGLACARELARAGWRPHLTYRTSSSAAEQLTEEFGGRLHQVDATQPGALTEVVRAVVATDGRLDACVHSIGEYEAGPLEQTSTERLGHLFRSNVESAVHLIEAARPALRNSRGAVVLFGCSSLAGLRARRGAAAYVAAKTALLVLARSWALEEGPFGVRVNMVSPGISPHPDAHPETHDTRLLRSVALGRPTPPEDLARAVAFLLSPAASEITGVDLPVDGGFLLGV